MTQQITFIISVYIVGTIFSFSFLRGIKPLIRNSISPLLGLSYLSFSVGLLIIFNIKVTLISIYAIILILVPMQYYFQSKWHKHNGILFINQLSIDKIFSQNYLYPFLLFSLISIILVLSGKSSPGSDSTQFEGIGRFLANGGRISNEPRYLSFLLNGRLLVIGALHTINRLYGSYSLYALNPTIVIWSLIIFTLIYYDLLINYSKNKKLLLSSLFFIALLFSNKFYLQIFFIHSNPFAMIFFSLSIISLYAYSKNKNDSWLFLGSFLIGTSTLIRIDMLIFSLLYFMLLTLVKGLKKSSLVNCWVIYTIVSIPWRLFTLYHTPASNFYVNSNHIIILLFAHMCLAIYSFLIFNRNIKYLNNIPLLSIFGIFFLFILTYFYRPSGLHLAWEIFIKYRLFGQDWILLFTVCVIMLLTVFG